MLPLVYDELRRLAHQRMAAEPGRGSGLTLQPTALVHEAYLRVLGESNVQWQNRGHFFAAAAQAMRRILVERARRQKAHKHGGQHRRISLDEADIAADEQHADLLALDEALNQLQQRDPRKSDIVMLRYFAGLTIEQTAVALDLSRTVVKDEWAFARAWLHSELKRRGN